MNICIVAGARPNFIKVAPLIRAIEKYQAEGHTPELHYQLVYTGKADDPTLESSLFDDLHIRKPDCYLGIDCENLNVLMGGVMEQFDIYLRQHPTDVVVVIDDLASTMGVSIVTKKHDLELVHIAAGTRSFDIRMPKEINRLVIDGLSDILFTAGISNNSIANREGAELSKVYMVGNILIDNLRFLHNKLKRPAVMDRLSLSEGHYVVFTLNRKALIADEDKLRKMAEAMTRVAGETPADRPLRIIAPLRGGAKRAMQKAVTGLNGLNLTFVEPLSYLDFMYLTAHAQGVITDSGNVAEEATFNGVPCITLNSYTEHIETVKVGTNVLVGEDPEELEKTLSEMVSGHWKQAAIPERWDGRSAERIVSILSELRLDHAEA